MSVRIVGRTCSSCSRPVFKDGLCSSHYRLARVTEPIDWLPEDAWLEVCPECNGRANYCLRCLDLGYVPHADNCG